jgi:hypothetical protein
MPAPAGKDPVQAWHRRAGVPALSPGGNVVLVDRAGAQLAPLVGMDALVFALKHRVVADQVGGM